ncbi:MAG: phenylacetic acid degradation operon negative regulatory protein PaaX [Pseudomonadota bacterium]
MTAPISRTWIARQLRQDPPRAKSLVMTVFGDAIAPRGGAVWLGSLITLLAPLGISERAVRTSVFRLVEEGWLEANRSGRRSQYRLSAEGEKRFLRAHQRVYAPPSPDWKGQWTLVLIAPNQITAAQKNALKKELLWEGFAALNTGLFAYPGEKTEAMTDILSRTQAHNKVTLLSAADQTVTGALPLAELAQSHWPLKEISKAYGRFIRRFETLLTPTGALSEAEPEQAFAVRTLLIHAYRRVQLHDPQLPKALLGEAWPGETAYTLCRSIYQQLLSASDQYVTVTLQQEQSSVRMVRAEFRQRFAA